ncbi:MAG: hypothetical protein H6822_36580 [Planctomycetaceae bacterium]|nr:hypothetical protein [Planctomycetales bacterium]MCB9927705.1 hypothetical protein [Planctomycetaceae bacterium]
MSVLYLTKDLFLSSRVCSLARKLGVTIDVVASTDDYMASEEISLVIIDLGLPALDVENLIGNVREFAGASKIIAYGPHVDTTLLSAAERAGCDRVLPRSQFNQQIEEILKAVTSSV